MDRVTGYRSEVPYEIDFLNAQRFFYEALGLSLRDLLGTSTLVSGLACNPTSPASLAVTVGPGRIYSLQNLEPTDWGVISATGGLAADVNAEHQIVKQGLVRDTQSLTLTAPSTPGQSINYLIQIGFAETDAAAVFRPFYNPADPTAPISTSVSVLRADQCLVQAKAGTAATSGAQTTPAPDVGFVAMWVVTVDYGATALTGGNIAAAANAPKVLTQAEILALIAARFGPTNPPAIADVTGLTAALAALTPSFAQGAILGLGMSNTVGHETTQISVAVGAARDSTNTTDISLVSPIAKDITAGWTAGSGNGGRDSATAFAANSYGHVHLIWKPGPTVDLLFSSSATAPTLPTGYTKWRRVGSFITDASGNVAQFIQTGRKFDLVTATVDIATATANGGGVAYLRQLIGVPRGLKFRTIVDFQSSGTVPTGVGTAYLSLLADPDKGTPTVGGSAQIAQVRRRASYSQTWGIDSSFGAYFGEVTTNSNGQIYTLSSDTADVIALKVTGWIDDLGGFN